MDPTFWRDRWRSQQIGFHQPHPNPHLVRHHGVLGAPGRVLVPLAGKSLDLPYLASLGHEVVGIELVPEAVEAFFREQDLTPARRTEGAVERFEAGALTFLCADIFAVTPAHVGAVSAVYDRAALVALPPPSRKAYAAQIQTLAGPHAPVLLVTLEGTPDDGAGPPFVVGEAEVHALFGEARSIEPLETVDTLAESPRLRDRGFLQATERVFALSPR